MQRNDILGGEYILEAYRKVFQMEIGGKEMTQELTVQAWLTDFDSQNPQKVNREELYKAGLWPLHVESVYTWSHEDT